MIAAFDFSNIYGTTTHGMHLSEGFSAKIDFTWLTACYKPKT